MVVLGQCITALLLFWRRYGSTDFEAETVVAILQDIAAVGQTTEKCGRHLGIPKTLGLLLLTLASTRAA